ncbi:MG2 domain-containing protein [Jiella marina]|uniref:MG2 domain-containing protein n=1 Tax=Jiella sp. LLJ827 TaxID=2917712 RepID=UPI0021014D55|nr:MG2 domain-containing protein [Jiella sp. LLJ827]MCQ0988830.1 MG2 domain-containing protein [Jiella sp. LLJ827]
MFGSGGFRLFSLALIAAIGLSPVPALAQAAGERNVVITRDADYFGRDYNVLRGVDLDECSAACKADDRCQAFTLNERNRWCFLKEAVGELRTVAGATSGKIVAPPPVDEASLAARERELDFVPQTTRDAAKRTRLELTGAERDVEFAAVPLRELRERAGAALTFQDAIRLWREVLKREPLDHAAWQGLSTAALAYAPNDYRERTENRKLRKDAAVNAYLTASNDAEKAAGLAAIAETYESESAWKQAIRAYRASLAAARDPAVASRLDSVIAAHGFRIVEHTVDNNAASPRICLIFSDQLSRKLTTSENPGDYISVEGGDTLPVTAEGKQICVEGVTHGERYRIVARPGITAIDGERLAKQAELSIYVRDRDPSVRFSTNAYVLPAGGKATIPVVTVNADMIEAKVQRIGERGLSDMLGNDRFLRALSEWQIDDIAAQSGEDVWSGTVEVVRETNEEVTTAIPVAEMVPDLKPGVYVLTAKAKNGPRYQDQYATQWFVVSDIGLSTFSATDGFHVVARSLGSARPLAGVSLDLVAANNQILGTATTDGQGHARLPAGLMRGTGGDRPSLVTARLTGDFVFLNVGDSPFDLTDRGVDGRAPAGPIDVFLTADRGIYRAGDEVRFNALTRDPEGTAISGLTLTQIVKRPDGVEHARATVSDFAAGGYAFALAVPDNAMRGVWKLALHTDPKQPALAETSFLVEDFEPEKIDFDLAVAETVLDPQSPPTVDVDARYLFGAPAGDLEVSGEAVLNASSDIAGYPGYAFGLASDEVTATRQPFDAARTDAEGKATLALSPFDPPVTTRPLTAELQVRVIDAGGKPVERTSELPLAASADRIGIKPRFDGAVAEGSEAAFDVIAIDADATRKAMANLTWQLDRIRVDFQWYSTSGSWNYEPVRTSTRVASGTLDVTAETPASLSVPVEWGEYRLTVTDADGATIPASVEFNAGWYSAATSLDTPDAANVSLDKESYTVGDTATVKIEPRFAGRAEIFVMDERVIARKTADIGADGGEVTLDVTRDWGTGAYVAAVVYRPMNLDEKRMPGRAIGLAHVKVEPGERALDVAIDAPDKIAPRQTQEVGIAIGGIAEGETAYVTLAAVDVGILNVTGFEPPAPKDYYFGQRRLGVEIRDLYSKLIDRTQGAPGTVRSGGDSGGSYDSPPPMDELVSLYSGPVEVGPDGKVTIALDIPDFNGTLKLMAIAWSKSAIGNADREMIVRDPVVIAVSRPAFLAPGDTSRIAIDLTHVEGPTGGAKLTVSGGAGVVTLGENIEADLTLDANQREQVLLPVTADAIGEAVIEVALTTPADKRLVKTVVLPVRSNAPKDVDKTRLSIAANGGKLSLDPQLFAEYVPGTASATISVTGAADFDVAGVVRALDRYPYGCTEQLTSRAMPLVYLDRTILSAGLGGSEDVTKRVDDAIDGVLANQASNGSFGLWRPDYGDLWLDAYVTDFLTRAKESGYTVPEEGFTLAIDNLRNSLAYLPDKPDWGPVAYAYYVLARNGRAAIGDLRYYADNELSSFPTPLAKAQIAAALAFYGDRSRAETVFRAAVNGTATLAGNIGRSDYGTALRDDAAVLTLGLETAIDGVSFDGLVSRVNAQRMNQRYTSTQEDAWSLLAAHALLERNPPQLTVAGQDFEGPYSAAVDADDLSAGLDIANRAETPVAAEVTIRGVPETAPPASSDGYAIARSYYTLDGKPANPSEIGQGDRLVVVDEVTPIDAGPAKLMLDDPLPAGFSIDNPAILRGGDVAALDWLELTGEATHTEFRTDRFLAAIDQGLNDTATRRFAYIVRAVSPGEFEHPAAIVENMYDPSRRGRTEAGRVTVIGPLR